MSPRRSPGPFVPAWLSRLAPTVFRCHMIGSTAAVALIFCTAWVCSLNQFEVSTIEMGGASIDLIDASTLIENADQWRHLYTVNYQKKQLVDERVDQIGAWLPRSLDWSKTQTDIHFLAEAAGVSISSLTRGEDHTGTRVGVALASCDAEGSYAAICRFLFALNQHSTAIACSEIRLQRTKKERVEASGAVVPLCQATLYLRIPFAASDTPADPLLMAEANHAG